MREKIQEQEEQEREFTGVWIPRNIIEDNTLNWTDKAVYAEISCYKTCFMGNNHLAKLIGITESQISKIIKKLKDKGYIEQSKFDGRKRYLNSTATQTTPKVLGRLRKKAKSDYAKSATIDNTIDNNIDNKLYIAETSSATEVIPDLLKDNKKYIQIIGLFAKAKKIEFKSKKHQSSFITRNLRASKLLDSYELDKIKEVMVYLIQNANFKWTLESVYKYIDEDLSTLKNSNTIVII